MFLRPECLDGGPADGLVEVHAAFAVHVDGYGDGKEPGSSPRFFSVPVVPVPVEFSRAAGHSRTFVASHSLAPSVFPKDSTSCLA